MALTSIAGTPGIQGAYNAQPRDIFYSKRDLATFIPGPVTLDGIASSNPQNTPYVAYLFGGMPVGRETTSGQYATSILGTTSVSYTSGGTSLTVSAATATELVRRIGSSGTFKTVGPPTANGTVATTTTTFSAVNTTTGVITVTSLGVDKVAGSFISPTDGSEIIVTLIADIWPVQCVAADQITRIAVYDPMLWAGGGIINTPYIWAGGSYPTDTSLQAYIKAAIRVNIPMAEFSDDLVNGV